MTFDLAHTDFAGELDRGGAAPLQGEGTEQRLLVVAPHLEEGELLRRRRHVGQRSATSCRSPTSTPPSSINHHIHSLKSHQQKQKLFDAAAAKVASLALCYHGDAQGPSDLGTWLFDPYLKVCVAVLSVSV